MLAYPTCCPSHSFPRFPPSPNQVLTHAARARLQSTSGGRARRARRALVRATSHPKGASKMLRATGHARFRAGLHVYLVGLQPTVIASCASPPLLEQSSRFKESWTRVARQSPVKWNHMPVICPQPVDVSDHCRRSYMPRHVVRGHQQKKCFTSIVKKLITPRFNSLIFRFNSNSKVQQYYPLTSELFIPCKSLIAYSKSVFQIQIQGLNRHELLW